jgi:hypothetical protein
MLVRKRHPRGLLSVDMLIIIIVKITVFIMGHET